MSAVGMLDPSTRLDSRGGTSPSRRTDFDVLRILACSGVILLHVLLIFAEEPIYHLKSAQPSWIASILSEFLRITAMVVFFIIAGWAAVASLRRRRAGAF